MEEEIKCLYCDDTGIIAFDEQDANGNWRRGVEEGKCICRVEN